MLDVLSDQIRQSRYLYPRIKQVKYGIWRLPVLGRLVRNPIELDQMQQIAEATSPVGFQEAGNGSRVLFFTLRAWSYQVAWDVALAAALRLRGASATFFTCGSRLPLCDIASFHASPPTPCNFCAEYTTRALNLWRFPTLTLHDLVSPDEIAAIRRRVYSIPYEEYKETEACGLPVGKLVTTSVRWFLCSGTIGDDPLSRQTYRDFLASGIAMARLSRRLLDHVQPDKLYVLNGLFFAERILVETARLQNLPFITHEVGFRPNTQVFAHNNIAGHFPLDDAWARYRSIPLTYTESEQLDVYLTARRSGGQDASRYYPTIEEDRITIAKRLGLRADKRLALAMTNILWDSAVLDRDRAFDSMIEWLACLIDCFLGHKDFDLVIRIHPAEVRLSMQETRERVDTVLTQRFSSLPPNVKLVLPESDISTYKLMEISDIGLVYTSTTGLEMALLGKPVIVAGKTHYAGKGFTHDPRDQECYQALLLRINELGALSPHQLKMARRYAYLFFLRNMIRFSPVSVLPQARVQFNFNSLEDLGAGRWPDLDHICQSVLDGLPFPDE